MLTLALMSYLEAFINSMSLSLLYLSTVVLIVFHLCSFIVHFFDSYQSRVISLAPSVELCLYASVANNLIKKLRYLVLVAIFIHHPTSCVQGFVTFSLRQSIKAFLHTRNETPPVWISFSNTTSI